ncbi:MAG: YkgJ family cysteine cluster protein [Lachnospiraceae bacterium]|nr:YkgJ family cysteine cluster protein [Lachnospiraceae bacterium]
MEHKVNLEEISDGKLYTKNDMVRLGCDGCAGAASCCRFAEDTITLDPYDIYRLTACLRLSFEELYKKGLVALAPSDGLLLPHLNFSGQSQACPFLEENGRCGIHDCRPGLCRLFPLARYFKDDALYYILQIHECPNPAAPKIKIKKWLALPNTEQYEGFLIRWNRLITETKQRIQKASDHAELSALTTSFLKTFFFTPYDADTPFYEQFAEHIKIKP